MEFPFLLKSFDNMLDLLKQSLSEIIATPFGFLPLRKYAMIELSNPPDNEIILDLQELQDSSKIWYNFLETSSNNDLPILKLK